MKILIVGTRSKSQSNLESFMCRAFQALGHDVNSFGIYDHPALAKYEDIVRIACTRSRFMRAMLQHRLGITEINQQLESQVEMVRPDLLIGIKAELVLPDTVRRIRSRYPSLKTGLWFTDDPRYFDSLISVIAPAYEHIFSVSPIATNWYSKIGIHQVHHLPVGCDPELHCPVALSRDDVRTFESDVCFVGTYYPNRARILRRLQKCGFRVRVWGKFWTRMAGIASISQSLDVGRMSRAFAAAKVVLNIHHPTDIDSRKLNMRTFEATASGSFLLTDRPQGLEEFFSPDRELVCYETEDELVQHVKYYTAHDRERREIAQLGQERARRDHTYRNRALALLEAMGAA